MKKKGLLLFLAFFALSIGLVFAQGKRTSGKVIDEEGEPIIGATVKVVGTSIVTATDLDGRFTLNLSDDDVRLSISYLGMLTQEVKVTPNMVVKLVADSQQLDEVIVTGYGNFKKSTFTGAASSVNPDKLADVPTISIEDKLVGSVPGVTMSTASGAPGAVNNIRIRGMGSVNASREPLYVIDGTPMLSGDINAVGVGGYNSTGTNALSTINANDIESITVIKDAAAASLYGSRAANGVIVITTKSGKKGKTRVEFRSDWGVSNVAINYRPMLGGDERRTLLWTGLKNYALYGQSLSEEAATTFADNNIDTYAAEPETGWTDWKKILFNTGHHQNYQASVSGGGENTKFYASLSYTKQDGIFSGQDLERFTGNVNLEHTFGRFNLKISSLFSHLRQSLVLEGTSYASPIANYAFFQTPSSVAYNADGSLADGGGYVGLNPVYEQLHQYDWNRVNRAFNTVQLTYNVWDNLRISEKVSYDVNGITEDVLWDRYSNNGASSEGVMQRWANTISLLNTQLQLAYAKTFGNHGFDGLFGFETEHYHKAENYLNGTNYPGDLYELGNAGDTSAESYYYDYKLTSLLGRMNYNYLNRYYFGASFRTDGSSRLSKDNRWGQFFSISGSWRFSDEPFMASTKDVLSDGKLRISYGTNGTLPSSYYGTKNLYYYGEKYNGVSGMAVVGVANPDLKWEKNKAFNLGLDLTFINRISLTLDYYNRTTSDLIYDLPISAVPGYYQSDATTTMATNIGEMRNRGIELTLQTSNIQKKDFEWSTSFNIGHNSNKITKLYDGTTEITGTYQIQRVGNPYYSFYLYEYAGVDPDTGVETYYINDGTDNARNTTTSVSEANRVIVGNNQPDVTGGITNNLRWKFIDLGFTFTYSIGGEAFDRAVWQHDNGGTYTYYGAVPAYYDLSKMWTGAGDTSAELPKFQYGSSRVNSSRWLMPTDYLRLKNLTLGFTLPAQYTRSLGMSKLRAYFSANNLLTWKSSKLFVDPELPETGLATFQTPAMRTFTFGVEIGI